MPIYHKSSQPRTQFSLIHRSLMRSDELPLQSLVTDQRIAEIFEQEQISFGEDEDAVYTPAITLRGLLSQVFFKEEQRSCLGADSYYCTYWLLAACRARGVHVVMRNHHLRDDSPADARRLVKGQCIATWVRPQRPDWMDEATYTKMPESHPFGRDRSLANE